MSLVAPFYVDTVYILFSDQIKMMMNSDYLLYLVTPLSFICSKKHINGIN